MDTVHLKINGIPTEVPAGSTIMEAAKSVQIEIPSLCYLRDINCIGSCRVCVVEVKGRKGLVASCVYPVEEGMEVFTNTAMVRASRKTTIELILSSHRKKCLSCVRGNHCELQKLAFDYEVDEDRFKGDDAVFPVDDASPYIVRDNSKCIQCMRCVAACKNMQSVSVIGAIQRGYNVHVGCAFEKSLADSPCVGCGQAVDAEGNIIVRPVYMTDKAVAPEYYGIKTADDMAKFAMAVNTGGNLNRFMNEEGTVVLLSDVDMTGVESWIPVGTVETPFEGVFDGKGFSIKNILSAIGFLIVA